MLFRSRCACLAGYTPDLSGCAICGESLADKFDVAAGHLECVRCRDLNSDGIRIPITPGVLDAMRYICFSDPKQIFSYQLGEDTRSLLSQVTELYLITQLERGFPTLDFYKSLLIMR